MLRIHCDFNDRTLDDCYWLLFLDGKRLSEHPIAGSLSSGDKVLLYQDEADFEVEGSVLIGRHPEWPEGAELYVRPNWATKRSPSPSMGEG